MHYLQLFVEVTLKTYIGYYCIKHLIDQCDVSCTISVVLTCVGIFVGDDLWHSIIRYSDPQEGRQTILLFCS